MSTTIPQHTAEVFAAVNVATSLHDAGETDVTRSGEDGRQVFFSSVMPDGSVRRFVAVVSELEPEPAPMFEVIGEATFVVGEWE